MRGVQQEGTGFTRGFGDPSQTEKIQNEMDTESCSGSDYLRPKTQE